MGRRRSIASGIAVGLARDGWDLALNYWHPYDERLGYEHGPDDPQAVADECRALGSRVEVVPGDLSEPDTPGRLVGAAVAEFGVVHGLVMCHCESVTDRLPPSAEPDSPAFGRIVALTSDHSAHNTPYGASKGALDRVVIAAAIELADRGVRANVINPGPIDTGWMTDDILFSNGGFRTS